MSFAGQNLNLPKWRWSWTWSWTWSRSWSWSWSITRWFRSLLSFVISLIHASKRFLCFGCNVKPYSPNADPGNVTGSSPSTISSNGCSDELGLDDLRELMAYKDGTDGGPPWKLMMDKSTPTLSYQAWFRDPQVGPTQYRTRTVFADVSPELVRDFFWDDEFRPKWDDMLVYFRTLDVLSETGTMIVHWIRKLPLFWNDREYVIVRRIWESKSTYYCVTKAKKNPPLPRYENPNRVDNYFSSFIVRADGSRGSEVILFHTEDLGIPKDIVKMGVRSRMWGMVKKMDAGVQAYNVARTNGMSSPPSYVLTSNISTSFSPSRLARHSSLAPSR